MKKSIFSRNKQQKNLSEKKSSKSDKQNKAENKIITDEIDSRVTSLFDYLALHAPETITPDQLKRISPSKRPRKKSSLSEYHSRADGYDATNEDNNNSLSLESMLLAQSSLPTSPRLQRNMSTMASRKTTASKLPVPNPRYSITTQSTISSHVETSIRSPSRNISTRRTYRDNTKDNMKMNMDPRISTAIWPQNNQPLSPYNQLYRPTFFIPQQHVIYLPSGLPVSITNGALPPPFWHYPKDQNQ